MSAPDTNMKKQERRHKGPLIGMAGVLIFAAVIGFIALSGGGDETLQTPPAETQATPAPEN